MIAFRKGYLASSLGRGFHTSLAAFARREVEICGETFTTQVALQKRAKALMTSLDDPKEQSFAKNFVAKYDKVSDEKKEIKRVYAKATPKYNSVCMHVEFKDGQCVTVAHGCVARSHFKPQEAAARRKVATVLQTLRDAISPQITDFRRKADPICNRCGISYDDNRQQLDVDHNDPTFMELVKGFTKKANLEELNEGVDEAAFAEYHRCRANLQLLCKECHYQKSAEDRRPSGY